MSSLKLIGYWRALGEPRFPQPQWLVEPDWRVEDRARIADYLRSGRVVAAYLGYSYCRFKCGIDDSEMGDSDLTGGVWLWPAGLAHYVEAHSVGLPEQFIDTMRRHAWQVPDAEGPPESKSLNAVDDSFWVQWARQRRPCHVLGMCRQIHHHELTTEDRAMSESRVFMFDNSDPEMQQAYENSRATFRYFWREMSWERRRIVPTLDLACVKAPFSDGDQRAPDAETPDVEHMWMSDVDFDGRFVSGELINAPNWLTTVQEGDSARIPLGEISDWMYAIDGEVFGAYTVNLLRSRMGRLERREHDEAWGLNFGDPTSIRVAPKSNQGGGFLTRWFGKREAEADTDEHPMSEGMALKLKSELAKDPSLASRADDRGWTFLHQEALAGNAATVKVLLEAGADRNAVTNHGQTPLQLAQSLGWDNVVAILTSG